jgi:hypothetical protein
MIAGTLELDMTANMARLSTDIQAVKRVVVGNMGEIEKSIASAKGLLETLGVGLSIGALVAFAKSTIDAIGRMKDLAEQAGTTAVAMSKFEAPTRLAGQSLDIVAQAMDKMSRSAVQGLNPLSSQAQAFAAIGISTEQLRTLAPDQLFELIARQLDKYSDGISKNAVMQAIFSRGGAEMNSVMKQIAATTELHASVTQKDADAAKHFQEQMVELQMAGDKFWRAVAADWLPGLTKIVKLLTEAAQGMGLWKTAFVGVASIFGIDLSDKATKLRQQIIDVYNAIQHPPPGLGANQAAYIKRYTDELEKLQKQLAALQNAAAKPPTPTGGTFDMEGSSGILDAMNKKPAPNFDPEADAHALAAKKAFDAENESLDTQIAKLRGVGEMEAFLKKLQEDRFKFVSDAQKKELADKEKTLLQLEDEKKAREAAIAGAKAYFDALDKGGEVIARFNEAATQQVSDLEFQNSLLGKSADEQAKLSALRQADIDLLHQIEQLPPDMSPQDYDDAVARLTKINELRKQGITTTLDEQKAIKDQLSIWGELGDKVGTLFTDLVEHGRGAFADLKSMVRSFFAEMVSLFAKRFVLQLGASATGGMGMSAASAALSNQAGSTGQGTLASAAMNGASSFTGIGQAGGILGTGLADGSGFLGIGFGATLSADFATIGVAMDAGVAAVGGAAELASAMIPVVGWIVAIAAILYSIFAKSGGGPKTQGAFAGMFGSTGNLINTLPGAENIADMHGTQDASNQQAGTIGHSIAEGIVQTITSLGGTSKGVGLFDAFSMDPAGTAPSFFHGGILGPDGKPVFSYNNDNMSRDPKEFATEVQAAIARLTVGALQNDSTLPEAIRRWVQTIDAATVSDDDIQRILKGAAALKGLIDDTANLSDMLKELADPTGITALLDSMKALDKGVTDAKKALDEAQAAGDPEKYAAAEQTYKQAVINRYQQEIAMVRQLQDAIRQTQQAAYQFAVDIAGRINAVGGNVDVAGIAMARAGSLRAGIGAPNPLSRNPAAPVATQIADLQTYVGEIDTWYQARRQAILDDAQKQADAINAANQARVTQLQAELDIVNTMKGIIDQANAMAKDMQLSGSNPLAAMGRLEMAQGDVDKLRAQFQGSTGADRATAAQALLQALGTERGLAESTLQRPSPEYQAIYNQIQRDLGLVGADGASLQQRQLDLTQQIADASGVSADAATIAKGQLDALDQEARGYYTWAQGEGERLYALQQVALQAQLDAITGGSDPEIWIAQKTTEMRDLLAQLVEQNGKFLDAVGQPGGTTTTGAPPDPSGGGPKGGNPIARPQVVVIHTTLSGDQVVKALQQGGAPARRLLATS